MPPWNRDEQNDQDPADTLTNGIFQFFSAGRTDNGSGDPLGQCPSNGDLSHRDVVLLGNLLDSETQFE